MLFSLRDIRDELDSLEPSFRYVCKENYTPEQEKARAARQVRECIVVGKASADKGADDKRATDSR
jgi:hypothetical protein